MLTAQGWLIPDPSATRMKGFMRVATLVGLLVPLLACVSETSQPIPAPAAAARTPVAPEKLSPVQDRPPHDEGVAPACPSLAFTTFLKAFVNSADLQDAYSAQPLKYKYPYYRKHNTQPGDPAHPKWAIDEEAGPVRVKYRYDAESGRFVWVSKKLKSGQRWISIEVDETAVSYAQLPDFRIRRVSGTQYDVEYDQGEIDTYELKFECWRFSQHWERESIVDCKWPDECRAQREYEQPLKTHPRSAEKNIKEGVPHQKVKAAVMAKARDWCLEKNRVYEMTRKA